MSKKHYEEVTVTTTEDGSVTEIKTFSRGRVEKDKFAMIYLEDIASLIGLGSKGEYKVLLSLVHRAAYNTNEVRVMRDVKQKISDETGLSINSVNKAISNLSKKNIILHEMFEGKPIRGVYILNPKFFFKGSDIERTKILKMVLEYELI